MLAYKSKKNKDNKKRTNSTHEKKRNKDSF